MPGPSSEPTTPDEPAVAAQVLGPGLDQARLLVRELADEGVVRGVVGPREVPRLWSRHVLNCAVLAELVPEGATVVDVGTGAGLPGLVLAMVRPDLDLVLVDSLLRRVTWLEHVVGVLDEVTTVVRARVGTRAGRARRGR